MGDHSLPDHIEVYDGDDDPDDPIELPADETPPAPPARSIVEVKVIVAALVTLLASLGAALLNALVANSELLGGLPPFWQFVIITGAPTIATFLAGYAKPSNRV